MTGLGVTLGDVRRMTIPEVERLFRYWRESPPVHEMLAMLARVYTTWEPELPTEKKLEQGAMGPAEFFNHFLRTGGKVEGMMPGR